MSERASERTNGHTNAKRPYILHTLFCVIWCAKNTTSHVAETNLYFVLSFIRKCTLVRLLKPYYCWRSIFSNFTSTFPAPLCYFCTGDGFSFFCYSCFARANRSGYYDSYSCDHCRPLMSERIQYLWDFRKFRLKIIFWTAFKHTHRPI